EDRASVYEELTGFYSIHGQIKNALEAARSRVTEFGKYGSPLNTQRAGLAAVGLDVGAGQKDAAWQPLTVAQKQYDESANPNILFSLQFAYVDYYEALEDAARARPVIDSLEHNIDSYGVEVARNGTLWSRARLHEIEKDYSQALKEYRQFEALQ